MATQNIETRDAFMARDVVQRIIGDLLAAYPVSRDDRMPDANARRA